MIGGNLRHLRVFLVVADTGSVSEAAARNLVTQPAVSQSIAKLERLATASLFERRAHGLYLTPAGNVLRARVVRALALLDKALIDIAPRLPATTTRTQLETLIAACAAGNFTLAARHLGRAQPTVHRAVSQLERAAGRALFRRSASGILPGRAALALAQAAQLAFAELAQADAEIGDMTGREVGRITVAATPLSRSHVLPRALSAFRNEGRRLPITVLDGSYEQLLGGVRTGEIDFLVGALRSPVPIDDIVQERLFDDRLVIFCGNGHPLLSAAAVTLAEMTDYPWLVPQLGTPTREQFEAVFHGAALCLPETLVETGSVNLMREMVQDGRHLACISRLQARPEIERDVVKVLPVALADAARPIGITCRRAWRPTPAQARLLDLIRTIGAAAETIR
ncbi:LysR family transcriptional regulator [Algicella marina]|uniref:LysR family transcriptional regulator n=1 Tax=Algicella marina TaxID=2683284 RepID=A0A6P1T0G3_9RHOB|nr:LysR family transcriptional regulator [Algicella marina]QHQ34779.1 LysR family transcriptional regulator [Algicella marina]